MVVSNTSAIVNLAVVGQLDLLRQLYGEVILPEAVGRELAAMRPPSTLEGVRACEWIQITAVSDRGVVESLMMQLHTGEAEAIGLALEKRADLLLMDERRGRRIASGLGLKCVGLLGVIVEAKSKGLIPAVRPLLEALVAQAGFWTDRELYARVLAEAGES